MTIPISASGYLREQTVFLGRCEESVQVESSVEVAISSITAYSNSDHVFLTCWDPEACPPPNMGIGFVSSSDSSCYEAKENALYLSRVLGGAPVVGVHHTKCCGSPVNTGLDLLREVWDRFFLAHPHSKFVQYFFGDGSYLVASALQMTAHHDKIIVVGINPSSYPETSSSYYYRYPQSFFLRKKDDAQVVSRHPFSGGYYRVTFQDPAFTTPIQYAYYSETGFKLEKTYEQFRSISPEVASILGMHPQVPVIDENHALQTEDRARQAQLLMHASKLEWSSRESWGTSRLGWLLRAHIAALRIMDHVACQFLFTPSTGAERLKTSEEMHANVYENKTLLEELYHNATQGIFPFCIYPCGINATGYSQYGKVIYDANRTTYFEYVAGTHRDQNGRAVLPCNISDTGKFPNGEFPYGKVKDSLGLFYRFFFNGSLTQEKIGSNLQEYKKKKIVGDITSVPQLYPSNITLNGRFINCTIEYPYGNFSYGNFSYKEFFSNDFDHNNKFIQHLNSTLTQPSHTGELQDRHVLGDTTTHDFLLDPLLSLCWATYGIAQLLLVSSSSSRIRPFALAIAAAGPVMDVADLIANLIVARQNHHDVNLRAILCAYAMTSLFLEVFPHFPPLLREFPFRLGISSTKKLITRKFRKHIYNLRVVFTLLLMLLSGSFSLSHYVTAKGDVVFSSIHGLFVLIVLPLTAFLLFKNPA